MKDNLREKINMSYTKLPYDFDMLYDIKSLEELYRVLKGEPHCTDASEDELCELMEDLNIPFPDWYVKPTPDIWIDGNGTYITYTPCEDEKHKWTPIFFKRKLRNKIKK